MKKIYAVGGKYYGNWMEGVFTDSLKDADLVLFTGGEDIDPKLYNSAAHATTWSNEKRDNVEVAIFKEAQKLNKKFIGICRGAQLLCALAGGTLVQHSRHPWFHEMKTSDGNEILVTSTHHQRQYPWGGKKPNFELLGWSENLSPYNYGEPNEDLTGKPEVEIARYPDIKALAIQSHPEMAYPSYTKWEETFIEYCRSLLDAHMES